MKINSISLPYFGIKTNRQKSVAASNSIVKNSINYEIQRFPLSFGSLIPNSELLKMGYKIAGFDIVGDGGGKFSIHTILQQAKNTQNGSILIYHFNKPKSNTRKSLEILIPQWKAMGYEFGLLE